MNKLMKALVFVSAVAGAFGAFAYNGGYENSIDWRSDAVYGYGDYVLTETGPLSGAVGANAFAQCKKLKSVDLSNVTSIGDAAFAYSALESVTIPATVSSMGYIAFGGCASLTTVKLDGYGFYNASSDSNKEPFCECPNLTTVIVPGGVPSWDVKAVFPSVSSVYCPVENVSEWTAAYGGQVSVEVDTSSYSVFYDLDGGSSVEYMPSRVGADQWWGLYAPTKPGYQFAGWKVVSGLDAGSALYLDESGLQTKISSEGQLIVSGGDWCSFYGLSSSGFISLRAVWKQSWEHAVVWDLNGGYARAGMPDTACYGDWFGTYAPARDGYVFAGWQVVRGLNPASAYYQDENYNAINIDSDTAIFGGSTDWCSMYGLTSGGYVVLRAVWRSPWEYSVCWNYDGGSAGGEMPAIVTCGTWFSVPAPVKSGYVFAGWQVVNGLDAGNAYAKDEYDNVVAITSESQYVGANAGTAQFYGLTSSGSVTLKAKWRGVWDYTVTWDLNGGVANGYMPEMATCGEWFGVYAPSRPGYRFGGWRVVKGLDTVTAIASVRDGEFFYVGSSSKIFGGNGAWSSFYSLTLAGAVTIQAVWIGEWEYVIDWDLDGGTASPSTPDIQTIECGQWFGAGKPTKPGYEFAGWKVVEGLEKGTAIASVQDGVFFYVESEDQFIGSNADWTSFYSLSLSGYVRIKAIWRDKWDYFVKWDLDGGAVYGIDLPSMATCGTWFGTFAPVKDGYEFAGWTASNGLDTSAAIASVQDGVFFYVSSDSQMFGAGANWTSFYSMSTTGFVTLTAHWTPKAAAPLSTVGLANDPQPVVATETSTAFAPGYYAGLFGDGVFSLLVTESFGGYMLVDAEDGSFTTEVTVEPVGDSLIVTTEDCGVYVVRPEGNSLRAFVLGL